MSVSGEVAAALMNSESESDPELIVGNHSPPSSRERVGRGWSLCDCVRRGYSPRARDGGTHSPPPKDHFNLVYVCMVLVGAGFLFPWNSYITAVDYFFFLYQEDFREVSVIIPMTYLITTLLSSSFNVATIERFPIHGRIGFGYVMFFISLLFVSLLDIGIHNCTVSTHVSFYLTLLSVVVVGLGSGGEVERMQNESWT